ncbi:MAG: hypothetical protein ACRD9R_14555, partial [Pyrinomonadaceae bacterium]
GTPHWSLRRVALLFALVPGLLMIDLSRLRVSAALVAERPAAARYLDVPAELRDRRAWVWADLLTGTLWYYARVPAYKVAFGSHENRALAYRLAFERGEPQYVVRDSEIMQRMTNEIEQMGGMLEPRGQVGAHPYFLIRWPPGGPNLSAF